MKTPGCLPSKGEFMQYTSKLLLPLLTTTVLAVGAVCLPPSTVCECTYTEWNPYVCGGAYCEVHSEDPNCSLSTSCSYFDWVRPLCDTSGLNRSYCEIYPSDTENCP